MPGKAERAEPVPSFREDLGLELGKAKAVGRTRESCEHSCGCVTVLSEAVGVFRKGKWCFQQTSWLQRTGLAIFLKDRGLMCLAQSSLLDQRH